MASRLIDKGCDPKEVKDFNELSEVTWCADKINDSDIEYQRKPIWHDLRENPNDLPKQNTWCVIGWKNRATLLSLYVGNKLFVGDQSGMTEIWMEIPEFNE